jgi:simple sugar transport system permease protein
MKRNIFRSYEFFLVLLLTVIAVVIGLINPAFFSVGTLFDIIRIQTIYILLAFGLLPVVILGGVDISFVAIAALSTYSVHVVLINLGYQGGIWLYYLLVIAISLSLGFLIGSLISKFKLGIFDLSLGMNTMLYGFVLFFVGSLGRFDMPAGLVGWNQKWLVTVDSVVGKSGLHISFLSILVAGIALHIFLRYSTLGRAIFAIGSDKSVAIARVLISKVYLTVFPIMGVMAGIAGLTQCALAAVFTPVLLMGKNMRVLAAVIMGGASIRAGKVDVWNISRRSADWRY